MLLTPIDFKTTKKHKKQCKYVFFGDPFEIVWTCGVSWSLLELVQGLLWLLGGLLGPPASLLGASWGPPGGLPGVPWPVG